PLDNLAVQLHDEPEDAMRGRVLRPEVDRIVADLLVAGVARVAKFGAFADGADGDFDRAGAGVGHALPRGFFVTSLFALAARGLRASLVACASAGAPPPVCAGVSVVFGVSAGVFTFCGVVAPGAGAGEGAPGASPCAFSSPGSRYSGPSHGIRKSKLRKSCGSDTGS